MVLCFSPDGQDGFFKALSIIKGEPITFVRLKTM